MGMGLTHLVGPILVVTRVQILNLSIDKLYINFTINHR